MVAAPRTNRDLPPLENGMRLEREEFHALFASHPEIKKAELVDGMVYMPSPTREEHGYFAGFFGTWLGMFALRRDGVRMIDNATVVLPGGQEVMPDALLRYEAGNCRLDDEGYLRGPPELVVEVAASSASFDLHVKRDAYRRAGVPEYVVFQVFERKLRWFRLDGDTYREVDRDASGNIESAEFPGLVLNVTALEAGDVRAAVGLES